MTGYDSKRQMAADKLQEPSATRPCRSCGGTGERWTGIDEAPTSICKPCDGTGQIALALPAQEPVECLDCGSNNVGFLATYDSLVNSVKAQPAQEPVAHLWECLGRWSAYLVENGKQADCAPPSWLVDAINKATTPPLPEQEPVAYVTGMSFGRFIVEPLNPAMVLPVGMALYSSPQGNT